MGSAGRTRGRRTRSDSGGQRVDVEPGFPSFEHNQWTVEGEIERLGAFARGASRTGGRRGVAARAVALVIIAPFLIFVVADIVRLIF
jgi:hypothetical protein